MKFSSRRSERRADFYHQVSTMTQAGLSPIAVLQTLRRGGSFREYGSWLAQSIDRIEAGSTLVEALQAGPGLLPHFDLTLLEAAETSGRIDDAFRSLAEYYREQANAIKAIQSQLLYPLLLVHAAVLLLPLPSLVLGGGIGSYAVAVGKVLIPLYLGVFVIVKLVQSYRYPAIRKAMERAVGLVPLLGSALYALALSRFCLSLEALLNAGVSMVQSWRQAGVASGSPRIERSAATMEAAIEAGWTPGEYLGELPEFPELFVSFYRNGEVSGTLEDQLMRLVRYFQETGIARLQMFAVWSPRIVYLIVVLVIAWQIVRFWSGLYGGLINDLDF